MKQVRKNGAGIHISAGLSGYVADLGAALVMADLGIAHHPRPDHAAYIASWLRVLKADARAIFTLASKAQAAADWMHTQQPEQLSVAA